MICLSPPSSLRFRFWQTAPASCTTWEPAKMLGINDFNLQNSKSVTSFQMRRKFRRCDENHIVHGARLDGGNPVVEVLAFCWYFCCFCFSFGCLMLMWRYFCCFFARPITTPGSVARERNWPEVETRLRVYSINFPFIPIFYLITLKWYCRPTKKVKTYETSRWNNQFAFPWEVGMYWNFTTSREKGQLSAKNSDGLFQLPLRLPHS